jgi:diguanylate cyclase (GGDEF)-like protein
MKKSFRYLIAGDFILLVVLGFFIYKYSSSRGFIVFTLLVAGINIYIIIRLYKSVKKYRVKLLQLEKKELDYYKLFQAMEEGIAWFEIIYDHKGNPNQFVLKEVNDIFASIIEIKEPLGKVSIENVLTQLGLDKLEILQGIVVTDKPKQYETYLRKIEKYISVHLYQEEGSLTVRLIDITENKKAEEEMWYISYHDQLTGLYNRRFYEKELIRLDSEAYLPLSIILADVNGLKLINDAFGHIKGDELLIEVAKVFKKACRAEDIIARIGGDEFVILLPNTSLTNAEKIIDRIHQNTCEVDLDVVDLSIALGCTTKNDLNQDVQKMIKKAENNMYRHKLFKSSSMKSKTIETIINSLHDKIKNEEAHSQKVSCLCRRMGEVMGFSEDEVESLQDLGMLHDIGKIAISQNIINKPGQLSKSEWKEIKRHPEIGYNILKSANEMVDLAEYVLAHHENWDGTGYPKGLKGEEIPIQARIVKIIDAYDAMTNERVYKEVLSKENAIKELEINAGTQFDPNLVSIFIEKVVKEEWG